MAFVYNISKGQPLLRHVVDEERGICIKWDWKTSKGDDCYPMLAYNYESPQLSFTFYAVNRVENRARTYTWNGKSREIRVIADVDILESTLKRGLSSEEYEKLKETLRDGMAVLQTLRDLDGVPIFSDVKVNVNFVSETPATYLSSLRAQRSNPA
jgi:hypothetical protein